MNIVRENNEPFCAVILRLDAQVSFISTKAVVQRMQREHLHHCKVLSAAVCINTGTGIVWIDDGTGSDVSRLSFASIVALRFHLF